ncbi:MAG: hypothetical protein ACYCS7_04325 [Acidimicrobiales bacterium]
MPAKGSDQGIPRQLGELKDLVVEYAKQQTIVPARSLARYVAFGMAGAVALAIGLGLAFLAGLRALQTETGRTFAARNSWLPYLICLAGVLVVAALAAAVVMKGGSGKRSGRVGSRKKETGIK